MKLVICEKPSVAREFAAVLDVTDNGKKGYLEGNGYCITWCVGHLVQMCYPESYDEDLAKWSMEALPFLPEKFKYEVIPEVREQYNVVSYLLNRPDIKEIYYAGDAAREGEYIGRLIRMMSGVTKGAIEKRVWIDSQTEDEILRGMQEAKPLSDYDNLSNAGYLRAIEDYLFGINLSRAYTIKYGNMIPGDKKVIAVGRVMSCVLGMVVDRERVIRNSKEIPFYGVDLETDGIRAEWHINEQSTYKDDPDLYKNKAFYTQNNAEELKAFCEELPVSLIKKERKTEKKAAPLLYNLAELQGECSASLKISPDETLKQVQSLYEKKLVTYPRTDARVLSTAVAVQIDKNLRGLKQLSGLGHFAQDILDNDWDKGIANSRYTDDSKINDHYAIIPTGEFSGKANSLTGLEEAVYEKIVKRFLSIFFPVAVYDKLDLEFACGPEKFYASSKKLSMPGYLEVYGKETEEEPAYEKMSDIKEGAVQGAFTITQGKTAPPKRYTTGSMVLAMENAGQLIEEEELRAQIKGSGIGTSATRADTIKKLITRGYLACNEKTQVITPTRAGESIYEILACNTPSLLNPKMTASWEKGLAGVESGNVTYDNYDAQLRSYVTREVSNIKNSSCDGPLMEALSAVNEIYGVKDEEFLSCPVCKKRMLKTKKGYTCSGHKDDTCHLTIWDTVAGKKLTDTQMKNLITKGDSGMIKGFHSKAGKEFDARLVLKDGKTEFVFPERK